MGREPQMDADGSDEEPRTKNEERETSTDFTDWAKEKVEVEPDEGLRTEDGGLRTEDGEEEQVKVEVE
jgi:hypothetical protein